MTRIFIIGTIAVRGKVGIKAIMGSGPGVPLGPAFTPRRPLVRVFRALGPPAPEFGLPELAAPEFAPLGRLVRGVRPLGLAGQVFRVLGPVLLALTHRPPLALGFRPLVELPDQELEGLKQSAPVSDLPEPAVLAFIPRR